MSTVSRMRTRRIRHSTPDTAWAMMVAQATLATPMPRSRNEIQVQHNVHQAGNHQIDQGVQAVSQATKTHRKKNAVHAAPRVPMKIICKYSVAPGATSGG